MTVDSAMVGKAYLFIISAPSGAGKTTLCKALRKAFPRLVYSVSATTRCPRPGERDGRDYLFVSRQEFRQGIETGAWAEWAEVHGNYYGTPAAPIDKALAEGRSVLLDIDVQGARQLLERYPEAVTIFIMPPDLATLEKRLAGRGTDSPEVIARRLENARREIEQKDFYRHVIVNDNLEQTVSRLVGLVGGYLSQADSSSK